MGGDGTGDTLTITDNRTGRSYEIPIELGAIRATELRNIRTNDDDVGLMSYDPAFMNTASCKSSVTFLDGERGILRYRGYPIEELAEHSSFLEVAYLLVRGDLPEQPQLRDWTHLITHRALSTFYPDAKQIFDEGSRRLQTIRLIAKMPTLAAFAFRHAVGQFYAYPDNDLSYVGNFLNMMWKATELKFEPNPVLEHALDVLFILHADHEQNCSAHAMRTVGSSHADPYSATSAASAALYGPLHGGANEMVLRMLDKIGTVERVPEYVQQVKEGKFRLMGFGHRVYKNYDPRARIIKRVADEVFEVTGRNRLLDIVYQAMGFPVDMFPVLFAIGRTPGWLAQWEEGLQDPEQKISRPRQLYVGPPERHLER